MESIRELVDRVIKHQHLHKNGYLFAVYPKKGNPVYPTFIHRDDLLTGLGSDENGYIGTCNIKFSRMVGLDDVFTVAGLKADAGSKDQTSSKLSQRVDDYISAHR